MSFKDLIRRDIKTVFHNENEHADRLIVEYSGKVYDIPVIIDHEGAKDRKRRAADNADGVFVADLTVYLSFEDMGIMPRKETKICIDGTEYNIVKADFETGEIVLDLEVFDE